MTAFCHPKNEGPISDIFEPITYVLLLGFPEKKGYSQINSLYSFYYVRMNVSKYEMIYEKEQDVDIKGRILSLFIKSKVLQFMLIIISKIFKFFIKKT